MQQNELESTMGQEVQCYARFGGQRSEGKARLESEALQFRGTFQLNIPLASTGGVAAQHGELTVRFPEGEAVFELDPAAEKWAKRIQHPPTLADKLSLKKGQRALPVGRFDKDFSATLAETGVRATASPRPDNDVIFLQAHSREDLAQLVPLQEQLKRNGALWVIRPRGYGRSRSEM